MLAGLLTVPAGVAFWGQRTLNDGQRYLATVGPLVDSPQVQDAISTKAIDAIGRAGGFRLSDGFISPLDLIEIGLLSAEEANELHKLEAANAAG